MNTSPEFKLLKLPKRLPFVGDPAKLAESSIKELRPM